MPEPLKTPRRSCIFVTLSACVLFFFQVSVNGIVSFILFEFFLWCRWSVAGRGQSATVAQVSVSGDGGSCTLYLKSVTFLDELPMGVVHRFRRLCSSNELLHSNACKPQTAEFFFRNSFFIIYWFLEKLAKRDHLSTVPTYFT